jgi:phospholipid-binding lipoprotein MlaA
VGGSSARPGARRCVRSLWLAGWLLLSGLRVDAAFAADSDAQVSASTTEQRDRLSDEGDEVDEYDPFDAELDARPAGFPDPLERSNRSIFVFNRWIDRWLLDPATRAYGAVFPGPVKRSIRNFFANLGEPATMFNDLLQLEWKDAGVSGARFVLNSTVGIAGLFDPAAHVGLSYHRSGFGQTLAIAGTPSGAYLVIPVGGPNNVRDGFGVLSDMSMHPLTWFLGPTNFLIYGIYGGSQGLAIREEHVEALNALRDGSVDYYAALRNAYYQNRMADIWRRREHRRDDWPERPSSGESGESGD